MSFFSFCEDFLRPRHFVRSHDETDDSENEVRSGSGHLTAWKDLYMPKGCFKREPGQGSNNQGQGSNNQGQGQNNQGQHGQGQGQHGQGQNNHGQGSNNQGQGSNNQGQGSNNQGQGSNNQGQGSNNQGQGSNNQGQQGSTNYGQSKGAKPPTPGLGATSAPTIKPVGPSTAQPTLSKV